MNINDVKMRERSYERAGRNSWQKLLDKDEARQEYKQKAKDFLDEFYKNNSRKDICILPHNITYIASSAEVKYDKEWAFSMYVKNFYYRHFLKFIEDNIHKIDLDD